VGAYRVRTLVGDVVAVLDAVGVEQAHVVGHDWGAAVAWAVAGLAGDRVDHLVAMSVGHPATFGAAGFAQYQKSWYMLLFQFTGVAEQWLAADGWANLRAWSGHPDRDAVATELEANGSLTPALNYYRANVPPEVWIAPPRQLPPITAPTMGVWSSGDMALTERQMINSGEHVRGAWRYERIEGAGHWMQLEAPERLNELLVDFLPARP
jgi:pimeloyl-ACP methyl ester carboxylesterase